MTSERRVLHFPADYSVGQLKQRVWRDGHPNLEPIADCRGTVEVAAGITLILYWAVDVADLSPLTALQADDLYGFTFPKYWGGRYSGFLPSPWVGTVGTALIYGVFGAEPSRGDQICMELCSEKRGPWNRDRRNDRIH